MQDPLLVCPECKNRLYFEANSYNCKSCSREYPVSDGVICFNEDKFYWQEGRDELGPIVSLALKKGWRQALEDSYGRDRPEFFKGLLDETRADFSCILPINDGSLVLDLGAGWGTISVALARQYKHIYALDACYEKMQFLQIRKTQSAIDNITCISADAFKLPFPDGFFDSVILYGVLEWAGYSRKKETPCQAQLKLMREVARVLKRGGCAYISIENRWALIYFLGFRDPHTGLPFVSIMPRFMARLYSRLMHKGDYNVSTHSISGYRKIFKKAGFSDNEFLTPLPSYRKFYYLVPLSDRRILEFFVHKLAKAQTRLSRILLFLCRNLKIGNFIKYFVSDYSIIAKK